MVPVYIIDFPPGDTRLGATDGKVIWLNKRLSQAGMRCTLAHEMEHLHSGHIECQPPHIEARVRRTVARRLIPNGDLQRTWASSLSLTEWAEQLHVTVDVLTDRLDSLTPEERAAFRWDDDHAPA